MAKELKGRSGQCRHGYAVYRCDMRSSADRSPFTPVPNRPSTRLLIVVIAGVVLSGLCLWVLARTTDVPEFVWLIGSADLAVLGAAVLSLAASMVVRAVRWRVLMPPSRHGVHISTLGTLPIVLVGYAGNAVLPMRLGDAIRGIVAARRFRAGLPEMLGSVGLERVADAAALAGVVLVASVGTVLPGWLTQTSLILVLAAAGLMALLRWGHPIGRRFSMRGHPDRFLNRLVRGLRARPRAIAASLGLSGVAWCLDGLTFWIGANALGLNIGWEVALLIAAGAAIGGILPSAPAAIGTFELAGTAVGVALGLDPTAALGVVAVGHAITVVPLIAAGGISAAWLGLDTSSVRVASRIATRDGGPSIAAEPSR